MIPKQKKKVVLAVHGGAGIILRSQLTPEMEDAYRNALIEAMKVGFAILNGDCNSTTTNYCNVATNAVEAAVRSMEDCPLFNAGKGSVFGNDGKVRMDAAIMSCVIKEKDDTSTMESKQSCTHGCTKEGEGEGEVEEDIPICNEAVSPHQIIRTRKFPAKPQPIAGSVAGVQNIKNPISLAKAVMEKTQHVMLIGKGAEEFASTLSSSMIETRPDDYFYTDKRWNQLQNVRKSEAHQLDHASERGDDERKFGTVGCVALYIPNKSSPRHHQPQLAAATSTGGMTNQRYNRIGDSPIIGAGTYANHLCAISCTGHGEHFIRCVAAHDIAKRMEYKHISLQSAVEEVIFGTLMGDDDDKGGDGGVIAIDMEGNFSAEMNCPGMYHGYIYDNGEMVTKIFWDE